MPVGASIIKSTAVTTTPEKGKQQQEPPMWPAVKAIPSPFPQEIKHRALTWRWALYQPGNTRTSLEANRGMVGLAWVVGEKQWCRSTEVWGMFATASLTLSEPLTGMVIPSRGMGRGPAHSRLAGAGSLRHTRALDRRYLSQERGRPVGILDKETAVPAARRSARGASSPHGLHRTEATIEAVHFRKAGQQE